MQLSFSELEYASQKKVTRRDRFLAEIEAMTPWSALEAELEAFYPKGGGRERPPSGLNRMLRMYISHSSALVSRTRGSRTPCTTARRSGGLWALT